MNYIDEAGSTLFHYSIADFIWSSGFVGVNFLKDFIKGLLHGYEWGLRFGGLELRFG